MIFLDTLQKESTGEAFVICLGFIRPSILPLSTFFQTGFVPGSSILQDGRSWRWFLSFYLSRQVRFTTMGGNLGILLLRILFSFASWRYSISLFTCFCSNIRSTARHPNIWGKKPRHGTPRACDSRRIWHGKSLAGFAKIERK